MRAALIGRCVLLTVLVGVGCSNSPTKAAIERVMKSDEKFAKDRFNLQPNATPSQIAWSVGLYVEQLQQLDMSDCPADFRVAYKHHMTAWHEVQRAVKQLPDGFLEGTLLGFLNGVLRGEPDGGASRIQGELKEALQRVRKTWEDVENIAAKYGATL